MRETEMRNLARTKPWMLCSVAVTAILFAALASAQTSPVQSAAQARRAEAIQPAVAPISDRELADIQEQLRKLLRMSPTLTSVVARDPSLLANQDYVGKNNPELAQFLTAHPEVARNPEFYLFTNVNGPGHREQALERAVWPDMGQSYQPETAMQRLANGMPPVIGLAVFLVVLAWMIRAFLENRRWGRIFKLQSEVHGRLIDKFSSNQELALYMGTEAGRRFLEAAPIPVGFEPEQRVPNAVARVLTPLQIGVVLVLLGTGLYLLRHVSPEMEVPILFWATVAFMPGLGFIISAGITWFLAGRLGLMPDSPAAANKIDPLSGSQDRQ
jgi:hypothetical protein